jgi:type IV pilus assembly protein PilX
METSFLVKQIHIVGSQKGMVLIVGLVMVLLLTIIALAAIRGSGLQEAMVGNMRERNVTFQAAESALRECEERDLGPSVKVSPSGDCTNGAGACDDLDITPQNSVTNNDVFWRTKARAITVVLPDVAAQPTCLVEVLQIIDPKGSAASVGGSIGRLGMQKTGYPSPFRVTAQGVGAVQTTPVVTQSTYSRLF